MIHLRLEAIEKRFGDTRVLEDVSFEVERSELIVLLGASGSGKSTLLRVIAGLEQPTSGRVWLEDQDVTERPPDARGVAMVFQNYALYPHMTVARNMGFALELAGVPVPERARRVQAAAEMLELTGLLDRLPKQLSGGQRQRVAIGRAVVREPRLFLFDEPLSNLDAGLRTHTRIEIKRLQRRLGTTAIYVTHDQIEAMSLATRICLLSGGRIEQLDTPDAIYSHPKTRFVAGFIGQPRMNFFEVRRDAEHAGPFALAWPARAGERATLGLRPQELRLAPDAQGPEVTIELIEDLGASRLVHARLADDTTLVVESFERAPPPEPGRRTRLDTSRASAHFFDASGARI